MNPAVSPADAADAARAALLAAYDAQLRLDAEMLGARTWHRHGPLVRGVFDGGGFVSYRDLGDPSPEQVERLIAGTVAWFRDETDVPGFEWKTRGHDRPADLSARLVAHGLCPEAPETVMVGRAGTLARPEDGPVQLPPGLTLRRAGEHGDLRADVARATRVLAAVFGWAEGPDVGAQVERVVAAQDRTSLWLVEDGSGAVVATGRLEVVPGTDFAGLWGGAVLPAWRGRGLYRALVGVRARAALARGVTHLHADCSDMSRPILERSGLVAVTTTTPYVWDRSRLL